MLSVRRDLYKDLFHKTSEWNLAHMDLDVEDTLDVMESFVRWSCLFMLDFLFTSHSSFLRVMPLGAKHGQLLFKSTTRASFSSFVDVDSVVISMLFDSKLTVPDAQSESRGHKGGSGMGTY